MGQFDRMDIWPVRPSAGQTTPEDRLPRQFLDLPTRPLVYVTLGTVFNDPELARGVLDALQDLPISIAITTGPGTDPSVLGPRPANVAAAPFVPQALVMPLASAVVSHTGSGTLLGALASDCRRSACPAAPTSSPTPIACGPWEPVSGCCPTRLDARESPRPP